MGVEDNMENEWREGVGKGREICDTRRKRGETTNVALKPRTTLNVCARCLLSAASKQLSCCVRKIFAFCQQRDVRARAAAFLSRECRSAHSSARPQDGLRTLISLRAFWRAERTEVYFPGLIDALHSARCQELRQDASCFDECTATSGGTCGQDVPVSQSVRRQTFPAQVCVCVWLGVCVLVWLCLRCPCRCTEDWRTLLGANAALATAPRKDSGSARLREEPFSCCFRRPW